jgi:hypothetical protein
MKLHVHRSLPIACSLCSTEDNKLYHKKLNVFHGARPTPAALLEKACVACLMDVIALPS